MGFFLWRSCRKIHDCLDKGLEQCSKYMNIIIYSALPKNKKTPNKTFLKSEDKHTHIQNTPSPPKKFKKKSNKINTNNKTKKPIPSYKT